MKPGRKVSIVWKLFQKDIDGKDVYCKICKKKLKFFGNTTNLKQHLIRLHPVQWRDETAAKSSVINVDAGPSSSTSNTQAQSQQDVPSFIREVVAGISSQPLVKDKELTEQELSSEKVRISSRLCEDNGSTSPENSRNSSVADFVNTSANLQHSENKNKRKRFRPSNFSTINNAMETFEQISDDNKLIPNEFDVFCESLAIQLKKMPLQRALVCQEKLQNVMTQERLFQLSEPYSSYLRMSSAGQHSMSIDSQHSDHYPTISSTDQRMTSNRASDNRHSHQHDPPNDNENDNKGENICSIKTEI